MRTVTALLLLLLLPALLVPAGVALRVCLCAPATAEQPSCCTEPAAPQCCGHCERSPAGDPDGERTCARGECRCLWLQAPDDPQPQAPLPTIEVAIAPPSATAAVAPVPAASPPPVRRWPAPDSRPPPPDRQRNLPLRL